MNKHIVFLPCLKISESAIYFYGIQYNTYPLSYKPKNILDPLDHLQFALKHQGYNQSLLDQLFQKLDQASILSRIAKKLNGVKVDPP